jgi:hypothetical protein
VSVERLGAATYGLRNLASADCQRQIALVIESWRYHPFERNGRAIEAEIVERVLFLPAERWRTTPREFSASVVGFRSDYFGKVARPHCCEGDRSASYVLQIRGTGEATMTERAWSNVPGSPLFVDAPARHFTIDRDTVERLVEQFRVANFFSLEEEYGSGITDQPGQILTFETSTDRAQVIGLPGRDGGHADGGARPSIGRGCRSRP